MELTDNQSPHALDDEQIGVLISLVMEDLGAGLTRTGFNDVMLWLFENIAGFETLPSKLTQWYLALLWSKYRQAIKVNPLH